MTGFRTFRTVWGMWGWQQVPGEDGFMPWKSKWCHLRLRTPSWTSCVLCLVKYKSGLSRHGGVKNWQVGNSVGQQEVDSGLDLPEGDGGPLVVLLWARQNARRCHYKQVYDARGLGDSASAPCMCRRSSSASRATFFLPVLVFDHVLGTLTCSHDITFYSLVERRNVHCQDPKPKWASCK